MVKSLDRMVGALEYYFDQYPLDTDPARIALVGGIPGIEWSFALPIPFNHSTTGNPLLYCGRTDAVVDFAGGLYLAVSSAKRNTEFNEQELWVETRLRGSLRRPRVVSGRHV